MGEFYYPIGIWSADGERMQTVDALVDTGASFSLFPGAMLRRLGIAPTGRRRFELADGSSIARDIGQATLHIDGDDEVRRVIFGDDDAESLIGANTLQGFLLRVDRVDKRLVRRNGRLKSPRLIRDAT